MSVRGVWPPLPGSGFFHLGRIEGNGIEDLFGASRRIPLVDVMPGVAVGAGGVEIPGAAGGTLAARGEGVEARLTVLAHPERPARRRLGAAGTGGAAVARQAFDLEHV